MKEPILITGCAVSGIYQIICTKNNKVYIGSSVNVENRVRDHFSALRGNYHHNRHLQRSFNKFGEEHFSSTLLKKCNEENLIKEEQLFIDQLNDSDFNMCKVADRKTGLPPWNKGLTARTDSRVAILAEKQIGKKLTKKQKEKTSNSLKGFTPSNDARENMRKAQKKRWSSDEERAKQSERLKGRIGSFTGKKHSEETKLKMRNSHLRRGEVSNA